MKAIRVYSTRIEIEPYTLGEFPTLEKMCSTSFDNVRHRREPMGFLIKENTLIIPRGISINYLAKLTDSIPTFYRQKEKVARMKYQYHMLVPPRDEVQKESIDFLLSRNQFKNGINYSQLALNLDPGVGKTYCAISAVIQSGVRTIITIHRSNIRDQWLKTLREKTDIDMDRVCNIDSSKKMDELMHDKGCDYDIFIVIHDTLASYAKNRGSDALSEFFHRIQCGIKIVDEAHLCFKQILHIDFFSDIPRNYYLTATFTRSDHKEVALFNRTFANAVRYNAEVKSEKHVIYDFILYNSNPRITDQESIVTGYGFNSHRYADYAFKRDDYLTIIQVLFGILEEALSHEGKTLITIAKIEYCEKVADLIRKAYPDRMVGTIHSQNTAKENARVKEEDEIIISTIGSLGTGSDIIGIRNLIIMEPFASVVTAKQLVGRLRKFKNYDSYAYELVDTGFRPILKMIEKRYKVTKEITKKINLKRI